MQKLRLFFLPEGEGRFDTVFGGKALPAPHLHTVSMADSRGMPASRNSAWICGSPSPAAGVIRARIPMPARSLTTLRPQPPMRCTCHTDLSFAGTGVFREPAQPLFGERIQHLDRKRFAIDGESANVRIRSTRFASVRPWRSSFLSRFFRLWMIASRFATSASLAICTSRRSCMPRSRP